MDSFISLVGVLLIGALSSFILKGLGGRAAPIVALAVILVSLRHSLPGLSKIRELVDSFTALGQDARYVSDGLRAVGIGYIGAISADTCSTLGEGSIASLVSLVTRIELIALAAPYLSELITTVLSFLYE